MIRFVREAAGRYRVESENGYRLATITDTKKTRTYVTDKGRRMHFGRWQTVNTSGAGIGLGEDTLAKAKERVRQHFRSS